MNTNLKRKVGRPPLGKVVFKRRVNPEVIPSLLSVIEGWVGVKTPVEDNKGLKSQGNATSEDVEKVPKYGYEEAAKLCLKDELTDLKKQLAEMTMSYEYEFEQGRNLNMEIVKLTEELNKVAGWSDDGKVSYWRNRAMVAEAQLKGKTNEFDQG